MDEQEMRASAKAILNMIAGLAGVELEGEAEEFVDQLVIQSAPNVRREPDRRPEAVAILLHILANAAFPARGGIGGIGPATKPLSMDALKGAHGVICSGEKPTWPCSDSASEGNQQLRVRYEIGRFESES